LKKTPGNRGVFVMSRDEGPDTRFVMLSLWDSKESIRAFAGPNIEKAFYYPDDAKFLHSLEPVVAHYQVRHQPLEED